MNEEMQLRYLYFLTHMYSGTPYWNAVYEAWTKFGNHLGNEKYEKLIKKVKDFHKKYAHSQEKILTFL